MEYSLPIGIEIQHDVAVMHDAARNFEINGDSWECRLEIGVVAGMEFISRIVAEYSNFDAGFYILQKTERF